MVKGVIKCGVERRGGPKCEGPTQGQSRLVTKALARVAREDAVSPEPVAQQWADAGGAFGETCCMRGIYERIVWAHYWP
jgi:hypothetical protein